MSNEALFIEPENNNIMGFGSQPNPIIQKNNHRFSDQNTFFEDLKGSLAGLGFESESLGVIFKISHEASLQGLAIRFPDKDLHINGDFIIRQYTGKGGLTALVPFLSEERNPFNFPGPRAGCKSQAEKRCQKGFQ